MRDFDVRLALKREIRNRFRAEPGTIVVDELGLAGGICRIDLAAINGHLHGYEIKSDADTLERLPSQVEVYNSVFDTVTIVVGERHLSKAQSAIPQWWGVLKARQSIRVCLTDVREPRQNPHINPRAVARLLWRKEMIQILDGTGIDRGFGSKPKEHLCQLLAATLSVERLCSEVRMRLKNRRGWRSDAQRV